MSEVKGILFVVSDLEKMISFFSTVLECTKVEKAEWSGAANEQLFQLPKTKANMAKLKLGNESIYLLEFFPKHKDPYPPDSCSNDLWFQHIAIVVSDMEKAYAKVTQSGAQPISESMQTIPAWNKAAAGIQAFYFRSPEGHPLELIYFPEGKGNPIWQDKNSLFLGIDHTAISVSNTEESIKFYQNVLGMKIAGSSLNYGETQEKLSGVKGAKVKITGLAFPQKKGMGIEFLEYQHPLDGRKKPKKIQAHHPMEDETIIAVDHIESTLAKLQSFHAPLLSGKLLALEGVMGFKKGIMTTDPDGHRILLVE
jgi:catechol 2,3-dioxygenase-like lactoylglutathione lyase family enzyme